jgi:hypothetical protein
MTDTASRGSDVRSNPYYVDEMEASVGCKTFSVYRITIQQNSREHESIVYGGWRTRPVNTSIVWLVLRKGPSPTACPLRHAEAVTVGVGVPDHVNPAPSVFLVAKIGINFR